MSEPSPQPVKPIVEVAGRVRLFGYDTVDAVVRIRPRARAWRIGGAVRTGLLFLVISPVVGIVPPHAPWIFGALGLGGMLARRRWLHRFTLESIDGQCPNCGAGLTVSPARLTPDHTLSCVVCHHESTLSVEDEVLARLGETSG